MAARWPWRASTRPRPRPANLVLLSVGTTYKPSPALSPRPEVVAAFERGRVEAASGIVRRFEDLTDEEIHERMRAGIEAVRAYSIGRDGNASAPVALPLALAVHAVGAACTLVLDPPRAFLRPKGLAAVAALGLVALGVTRAEPRRAKALGLDAATAPVPSVRPALFMQMLIGLGHRAWLRHRTGTWPRAGAATMIASAAISELDRRRAWNRALKDP